MGYILPTSARVLDTFMPGATSVRFPHPTAGFFLAPDLFFEQEKRDAQDTGGLSLRLFLWTFDCSPAEETFKPRRRF